MSRHEHEVALLGEQDELLGVLAIQCHRLLDEHVLPGFERPLGEGVVGHDWGCDHDCVEIGVV